MGCVQCHFWGFAHKCFHGVALIFFVCVCVAGINVIFSGPSGLLFYFTDNKASPYVPTVELCFMDLPPSHLFLY